MASPAVNKLKTVGNQQDNYMLTKESGAQKRVLTKTLYYRYSFYNSRLIGC